MLATQNVIDQEKMAVILQEVVGKQYGDLYYPNFSGVLRSLNYYPIGDETAEEGIASLAVGLGKYIVDGGQTLRVSPYHPKQVLQTSEMETALSETQTRFYALDMAHVGDDFKVDDGFNIKKVRVKQAAEDGRWSPDLSGLDLRPRRSDYPRWYLRGRPKGNLVLRCAAARCIPITRAVADGTEAGCRRDEAPRRD